MRLAINRTRRCAEKHPKKSSLRVLLFFSQPYSTFQISYIFCRPFMYCSIKSSLDFFIIAPPLIGLLKETHPWNTKSPLLTLSQLGTKHLFQLKEQVTFGYFQQLKGAMKELKLKIWYMLLNLGALFFLLQHLFEKASRLTPTPRRLVFRLIMLKLLQ